jgi:hypothetical protein
MEKRFGQSSLLSTLFRGENPIHPLKIRKEQEDEEGNGLLDRFGSGSHTHGGILRMGSDPEDKICREHACPES